MLVRALRWLGNTILVLLVIFLLFVLVAPLAFSSRVAIVQSGSMGKALPTGALAATTPIAPKMIKVGDIITFTPYWQKEVTMSHRVVEVLTQDGRLFFVTKGDANENPDSWIVPEEYVTGRVMFHVPRLGYVADAALKHTRSWLGFAVLVALPSILLIGSTIRGVSRSANRRYKRRQLLLKRRQRRR
jgi:signal peptidase